MIKKEFFLLFAILLFSIFVPIINADDLGTIVNADPNQITSTDEIPLSVVENNYLTKDWSETLQKYEYGRIISMITSPIKIFDPIFSFLVGLDFSLSLIFFISWFIWIAILIILYEPVKEIFPLHRLIAFGISLIISITLSEFKITQKFVFIITPILRNVWIMLGYVILVTVILYLYSKSTNKIARVLREKSRKAAEERRYNNALLVEKSEDMSISAIGKKI